MGFINNLAGAGGLIGLIALDMAAGLSPIEANAALRPAALAIGASGLLGFLSKGQSIPRRAWGYGLIAIPGAVAGSLLVVTLPEWAYHGALLAVVAAVLVQQFRKPHGMGSAITPATKGLGLLLFTLVGLHMGFLQVAVGLVIMMTLSRVHTRDLVAVNAAKTAIVIATAGASTLSLAITDAIDWRPALWLAMGAAGGSFAASRWSIARGHGAVRSIVLLTCLALVLRFVFTALR